MQNQGLNKYGIMIMAFFAAIWFVWGLSALRNVSLPLLALPFLVSGVLIALASRIPMVASPETRRRTGQVVGWASCIEGLAIFAAVNVLHWTGHDGYAPQAAGLIVGLHFLPLAWFLRVPNYYLAGAAMMAISLAACAIPDDTTRLLATGTAMAALLWVTCVAAFWRRPSPATA